MSGAFSIAEQHPPRAGLTISTRILGSAGASASATAFSLGQGTGISPESYDYPMLYLGLHGSAEFVVGEDPQRRRVGPGELLSVRGNTPCGVGAPEGCVYLEISSKEELKMNEAINAGEVMRLADLVPYEAGSVVNMDLASNDAMKFVVMAFDAGTGLSPHRAPGDALVMALEGEAVIGYEGEEHAIHAGESFRFNKGGLHSVEAKSPFKMALLLTLR